MEVKRRGHTSPPLIMKTISESNIFEEAVNELDNEISAIKKEARNIDKTAFDIGITPSALVGSITGAIVANQKIKSDALRKQMENESAVLEGNYYTQVQNLTKNLKVIFTPFGVVYTVKNKMKEITIETIGLEEMSQPMHAAWQAKDYEFYKNLLLNKMYSEIQFVEQEFAKRLVKKQMELQGKITKKASIEINTSDLTIFETVDYVSKIKDIYEKKSETTEKLAGILLELMENDFHEQKISWEFPRPLEKYAFLSGALSFLGLGNSSHDIKSLQGHYLNPKYLEKRVKIGFLPDRVLFVVDNKLITTLLAMDMNEEGFSRFNEQDSDYFEKLFGREAIRGIKKMNEVQPSIYKEEKKASIEDNDVRITFRKNDIHPRIYFLILEKNFGNEWMNWDAYVLVKSIEDKFDLQEGISDIPLNKILSIQAANVSTISYSSYHAFEKIVRSLTDKSVNFLERETKDITTQDLAFALDVIESVTPFDNIYDDFSDETFDHITSILIDNNCKVFLPSKVINSTEKNEFYSDLNDDLLDKFNKRDIENLRNVELKSKALHENEIIHKTTLAVLSQVRKHESKQGFEYEPFVNALLDKLNLPEDLKSIISMQIFTNTVIDKYLLIKEEIFKEQEKIFGLR